MTEAMFPRSVVMAAGSEGFQRGWTEAVDACIAAIEALRGLTDDELLAPRALPETNEEWVAKARILSVLREIQT